MIQVRIKKEKNRVSSLEIKGHAFYDDYGKDIVCASVSTTVITTVNAALRYDSKSLSYSKDEGYVEIVIQQHSEVIDLLIENLVSLLKELEEQYRKNIKINE